MAFRRLMLPLIAISVITCAAGADDVEAILDRVETRGANVNDLQCKVAYTVEDHISDDTVTRKGNLLYKRKTPRLQNHFHQDHSGRHRQAEKIVVLVRRPVVLRSQGNSQNRHQTRRRATRYRHRPLQHRQGPVPNPIRAKESGNPRTLQRHAHAARRRRPQEHRSSNMHPKTRQQTGKGLLETRILRLPIAQPASKNRHDSQSSRPDHNG